MYQTVPPEWLTDMFGYSAMEIDTFEAMYQSVNRTPMEVSSAIFGFIGIPEPPVIGLQVYPNPVKSGQTLQLNWPDVDRGTLLWVDSKGSVLAQIPWDSFTSSIPVPNEPGMYLLMGKSAQGNLIQKKVHVIE